MTKGHQQSPSGRRQPSPFRLVSLAAKKRLSPRMIRATLTGPSLEGLVVDQPASSVRLLVPTPGNDELVLPTWNGNEFLLPDGKRPAIRTFTPRRFDENRLELDLEMVIHDFGVASSWAVDAPVGSVAAVSGTGRGYAVDPEAAAYVLLGDETALPAIAQLLEAIPQTVPIQAHIEVAEAAARIPMPTHQRATIDWHTLPDGRPPGDTLAVAMSRVDFGPGTRFWCAGEAAAMHRIRNHLFKKRGLPRSQATVRGYWKARVDPG